MTKWSYLYEYVVTFNNKRVSIRVTHPSSSQSLLYKATHGGHQKIEKGKKK